MVKKPPFVLLLLIALLLSACGVRGGASVVDEEEVTTFESLADAQEQVDFPVMAPAPGTLPQGFELQEVRLVPVNNNQYSLIQNYLAGDRMLQIIQTTLPEGYTITEPENPYDVVQVGELLVYILYPTDTSDQGPYRLLWQNADQAISMNGDLVIREYIAIVAGMTPYELLASSTEPTQAAPSPFSLEEFGLQGELPGGWTAAEGPEPVAEPFTGLAAFNSWGEENFWAREVTTETSARYGGEVVLSQIRANGAYIVLLEQNGGPAVNEGEQFAEESLGGLWQVEDCRRSGTPIGAHHLTFQKEGRAFALEVYCAPLVSDQTAEQVNQVVESLQFTP